MPNGTYGGVKGIGNSSLLDYVQDRSGNKKNRCLRSADASLFMTEWRSTVFFYMVEVRGIEPLSRNSPPYRRLQLISCLDNSAVCA